jgi:hypothetical protein
MLMSIGAYYVRWMDDYKVMGRDGHNLDQGPPWSQAN